MTNLTHFEFQSQSVRVLTIDGEPWFVAKDVCTILDLDNVSKALSRLDDDEQRALTREQVVTLSNDPDTTRLSAVSESGLYALALTSRKPEARPFRKWVTSEVLPAIRKTGQYVQPKTTAEMLLEYAKAMVDHERRLTKVEEENRQLKETLEVVDMETQANTAELERFRNGHGYYYSIAGYCNKHGHRMSMVQMNQQGRKASALCRQQGIVPEKVSDPRFGTVNTYPDRILDELAW